MSAKIAILGDGAWGTAVALLLAQNSAHRVSLWSVREENGRLLQERRENVRLLPGVPIPPAVQLTTDIRRAVTGADLWVAGIPTVYLRSTLMRIAPAVQTRPPILSLAKGLENVTFLRPTEILTQVLGVEKTAVLSGPSHAEEVSRGLPASVVVASRELELARWIQQLFSTDRFRIYTNSDPVGVELAGALKNIIGIAAGINDGLGLGDNAKAGLLTRGLVEMTRFGVALGAQPRTFAGLAGLGDLITTCISSHGRNHRLGQRLARGERWSDIQAAMTMVAEGAFTARSVHERAGQMGIDMPITTQVYRVLYENKDPRAAVTELMLREPKGEMESL
ncbi:MAG TPA: NAD(P)H-dependent glycerol-3-phosphate dehydrogenase [Gemmataceae bacterium]|nr:NAD(P)H-dependent glycerol-3-phosphate dehydrogenase [Gemmataceae bacterium]